jgi:hypothetical protein
MTSISIIGTGQMARILGALAVNHARPGEALLGHQRQRGYTLTCVPLQY